MKISPRRGWQIMVQGFHTVDHVLQPTRSSNRLEFLQHDAPVKNPFSTHIRLRTVALLVILLGPIYGAAMGTYAWLDGHREFHQQILQIIYSALKVPMLLGLTVTVSLPSIFVINSLFGLRDDFRASLSAIISAQAGLTIILASLSPLTLLFYLSNTTAQAYPMAILFNAVMFGLAAVTAQVLLAIHFRPLIEKNPRHRWIMRIWIFVYAFVGIQAGYVLRPFIGSPGTPTDFFRRESFQNAYVKVWELIEQVVLGG